MNTGAMLQAMQEKEMINLITELMKYREKYGKDKFKAVIEQMRSLLEISEEIGG